MNLTDNLIGGIDLGMAFLLVGALIAFGMAAFGFKIPRLKNIGAGVASVGAILLIVLVVLAAAGPAAVVPNPTPDPAFAVLAVTPTHGNYTAATSTITCILDVNKSAPSLNTTATHLSINFTVERTDVGTGSVLDIKTLTASYTNPTITGATSTTTVAGGIAYPVARPNVDGNPNVNWTMTGAVTATRTLTTQMGMTPYQTGYIVINIDWNPTAFAVSQTAANSIYSAGTVTVGGHAYTIQVMIDHVW